MKKSERKYAHNILQLGQKALSLHKISCISAKKIKQACCFCTRFALSLQKETKNISIMKTEKQQAKEAADFAKRWEGRGYEKGDSQVFWTELLTEVYGVENPSSFIKFEQQAQLDHTSFIDVMIPSTKVMIEQKSLNKDLRTPIKQSD